MVAKRGLGAVSLITKVSHNDVVAANGGNRPDTTIGVYLQKVDGTLNAPPTYYPAIDFPEAVEIADIDGDGRNDVIVLHGGGSIGLYLQAADGTLKAEWIYHGTGNNWMGPRALAVGDIDSDGFRDVVTAVLGNIVVFRHNH